MHDYMERYTGIPEFFFPVLYQKIKPILTVYQFERYTLLETLTVSLIVPVSLFKVKLPSFSIKCMVIWKGIPVLRNFFSSAIPENPTIFNGMPA